MERAARGAAAAGREERTRQEPEATLRGRDPRSLRRRPRSGRPECQSSCAKVTGEADAAASPQEPEATPPAPPQGMAGARIGIQGVLLRRGKRI